MGRDLPRKQLNIKLSPGDYEKLQKAHADTGLSFRDLLLQGAGLDRERLGSVDVEAGYGPAGLKVKRTPPTREEAEAGENPEVDGNPGEDSQSEDSQIIRPEIADLFKTHTKSFQRTDIPRTANALRGKGHTWESLNEPEKEKLLLELDGVGDKKHAEAFKKLCDELGTEESALAEQEKSLNRRLEDLDGQPTSQALDTLKSETPYFWWQMAAEPTLLYKIDKVAKTVKWKDLDEPDRALILSQVSDRHMDKLPEIARLLDTDPESLAGFRDRIIKNGKDYKLRPEIR